MSQALRVVLADDHAVLRSGLRRLLEAAGMHVVAEASNGEQAYQLFAQHAPDVLVMDLSMPGMGGIEALRRVLVRDTGARIVVFSMHESATFATQALRAGALGYVAKSAMAEDLIEAVSSAAAGSVFVSATVAQRIAAGTLEAERNPAAQLSAREFEIFRLLAEGHDLESIGSRLFISVKTVANQQTLIKQKLGVSTPVELVRLAIRHGVVNG